MGATLSARQAYRLGAIWYRDRLEESWAPKTVETMEAIFEEVGLRGPFWALR